MAFFDPKHKAVTLRIVYDGLGTAGKTTNIRQVHDLFTLARRGGVYVPEEHRGRTLYFDWLELEVGFVDEHRLRCQLLTVPGQFAYVQRRWRLLKKPDAVIAICDSSPGGVVRARYAIQFLNALRERNGDLDVPLVVQANKQDLPGALPPAELADALGLPSSVRVVDAVASTGAGVRETFMLAMYEARERARAQLALGGVAALEQRSESAEEVYMQMRDDEANGDEDGEAALLTDSLLKG